VAAEFGGEVGVELGGAFREHRGRQERCRPDVPGEFTDRPVVLDRELLASGALEPGTGQHFMVRVPLTRDCAPRWTSASARPGSVSWCCPSTSSATTRRKELHISMSAVEKNLNAIFDKLELAHTTGYNRRILAVLRYLES
jgi:hypothetical protein